MKTNILLPLFVTIALLFLNQKIKANQALINQECPGLEIASTLTYNEGRITDYTLIIYDENQSSDTIEVYKMKSIFLKLCYGHTYSLRYIKPGFLERVVMIDTKINEEKQSMETGFDFEVEMIPENNPGNTLSDLPVALIHYDNTVNKFEYSRDYHRQVRGMEITETDIEIGN